jgi:hypothetical protein
MHAELVLPGARFECFGNSGRALEPEEDEDDEAVQDGRQWWRTLR